jgi:hypothetical protein
MPADKVQECDRDGARHPDEDLAVEHESRGIAIDLG